MFPVQWRAKELRIEVSDHMIANPPWFSLQFIGEIWRFPKIGVPPNHQFFSRIFHEINYPAIGVPSFQVISI